jgi:hypothetical protein
VISSRPAPLTVSLRAQGTLLAKLMARAAALDETVFQSAGDSKADPAASAAAKGRYGGFWGPWQDDAAFARTVARGADLSWSTASCDDCE